jgi:copper chaperone CopZ
MSCRYELDKVERQLEQLTVLRVKVVAKMQEEAAR